MDGHRSTRSFYLWVFTGVPALILTLFELYAPGSYLGMGALCAVAAATTSVAAVVNHVTLVNALVGVVAGAVLGAGMQFGLAFLVLALYCWGHPGQCVR